MVTAKRLNTLSRRVTDVEQAHDSALQWQLHVLALHYHDVSYNNNNNNMNNLYSAYYKVSKRFYIWFNYHDYWFSIVT